MRQLWYYRSSFGEWLFLIEDTQTTLVATTCTLDGPHNTLGWTGHVNVMHTADDVLDLSNTVLGVALESAIEYETCRIAVGIDKAACRCDLRTVLLRTGCQCGGV